MTLRNLNVKREGGKFEGKREKEEQGKEKLVKFISPCIWGVESLFSHQPLLSIKPIKSC